MNTTRAYAWVAILFISIPVGAQQATSQRLPSVQRDASAVAVVQNAIQTLGGETAIKNLQTVDFHGSVINSSNPALPGSYTSSWQAPQTPSVAGTPPTSGSTPAQPATAATRVPFTPASVVVTLLRQLHSNSYALQDSGPVVLGTQTLTTVTFSPQMPTNLPIGATLPSMSPQTWYFNLRTGLPVRVEYKSSGVTPSGVVRIQAIDFSDYRSVSGVLYPFSIVMHRSDQVDQNLNDPNRHAIGRIHDSTKLMVCDCLWQPRRMRIGI